MHSKLNQLGDSLFLILSMLMMDIDGGFYIFINESARNLKTYLLEKINLLE